MTLVEGAGFLNLTLLVDVGPSVQCWENNNTDRPRAPGSYAGLTHAAAAKRLVSFGKTSSQRGAKASTNKATA